MMNNKWYGTISKYYAPEGYVVLEHGFIVAHYARNELEQMCQKFDGKRIVAIHRSKDKKHLWIHCLID